MRTGCILIVDPTPMLREIVTEMLEVAGFTTLGAGDAVEARQILSSRPIVLAVVDCMLPGTPGVRLANEMRKRRVPAVLMSGHPEAIQIAPRLGFPFVQKPFRLSEMRQAVHQTLHCHPTC